MLKQNTSSKIVVLYEHLKFHYEEVDKLKADDDENEFFLWYD